MVHRPCPNDAILPGEPAFEDCTVQIDGKSVHVYKATILYEKRLK